MFFDLVGRSLVVFYCGGNGSTATVKCSCVPEEDCSVFSKREAVPVIDLRSEK